MRYRRTVLEPGGSTSANDRCATSLDGNTTWLRSKMDGSGVRIVETGLARSAPPRNNASRHKTIFFRDICQGENRGLSRARFYPPPTPNGSESAWIDFAPFKLRGTITLRTRGDRDHLLPTHLRRNPLAAIGLLFVVLFVTCAIFASWLAPQDPARIELATRLARPSCRSFSVLTS
jgi:hypothetical protein